MIGNIIILLTTWLLLRFKNKSLSVLAAAPFLFALLLLITGFMATAFPAGSISAIFAWVANFTRGPTAGLGVGLLVKGLYNYI